MFLKDVPIGSYISDPKTPDIKWKIISHNHFGENHTLLWYDTKKYISEFGSDESYKKTNFFSLLNNEVYPTLSNNLKTNIIPTKIKYIIDSKYYEEVLVNLFVLSATELGIKCDNFKDGNQISFFKDNNARSTSFRYITRTSNHYSASNVVYIYPDGDNGFEFNLALPVLYAFNLSGNTCVSEAPTDSVYKILWNTPPEINNITATFPNLSFDVSDKDGSISKVDILINDSIKFTIQENFKEKIKVSFKLSDFKESENIIKIRAFDNLNESIEKKVRVVKNSFKIPKENTATIINNKPYKILKTTKLNEDEFELTLDKNLESVSSINDSIEVLNNYATVKINDKLMNHVRSKALSNGEIEDKFELDINTRKVITRVDLFRENLNSNIYIKEIQEAFQYDKD